MPYDGNGNYVRVHNWTADQANALDINATEMDAEDNGFAAALSNAVTRDGQGKMAVDFLPNADNTLNLGSGALRWATINGLPINSIISGIYYARTAAEVTANAMPVTFTYPPGSLLRFLTAVQIADVLSYGYAQDCTAAINTWLSVGQACYAPGGGYKTTGGHTINAKQDIVGDGIQRTIFNHTGTSNICFSIPLYGTDQGVVEYGGNRFQSFSVTGAGPTNSTTGFYVKNKTDINWDHVEITGFGYGVRGARDNVANSCTDLSFIACRVLNNGISLLGPLNWNGTVIIGGCWEGNTWSIILYDSNSCTIDTVAQPGSTAVGAIFMGGCAGSLVKSYCEGTASGGAFVVLADQQDVNGSSTNNGIAISRNRGNKVHGGSYSSGSGVTYACKQIGGTGCSYESIYAGSGISTAVVLLTTGTTGNFIGVNWSNPGVNASYQTATDQANNFEMSLSSGVSHFGTINTANIYLDEGNNSNTAEIAINKVGYQGGSTIFRRTSLYDGRGTLLFQTDGQNGQINLAAAKVFASSLPTSNPGAGSGQLWVNGGVVTRA